MCVSRCSSYGVTAYLDRRRRDPISAATPLGAAGARTTSLTGNFGCDGKRCGRVGQGRSGNLANRSTSVLRGRTNRGRRLGTLGGLVLDSGVPRRGPSGRGANDGQETPPRVVVPSACAAEPCRLVDERVPGSSAANHSRHGQNVRAIMRQCASQLPFFFVRCCWCPGCTRKGRRRERRSPSSRARAAGRSRQPWPMARN